LFLGAEPAEGAHAFGEAAGRLDEVACEKVLADIVGLLFRLMFMASSDTK
jgi:hypothetical protein